MAETSSVKRGDIATTSCYAQRQDKRGDDGMMASNPTPIHVTEETDLRDLLDEAAQGPVLLVRGGDRFRLVREDDDIAYEPDVELVRANLAATLGSWADVDVDAMIADIYEARRAGSRPPNRP
jgi:hypothetical protein